MSAGERMLGMKLGDRPGGARSIYHRSDALRGPTQPPIHYLNVP